MELVGDLMCPGVDVDAWLVENQAELFPGKTNVWLLARRNDDGLSNNELTQELYGAFSNWFDHWVSAVAFIDGRARFGDADNVKVESIGPTIPSFPYESAGRREALPGVLPTILAPSVVYMLVTFEYRGTARSMPWPVIASRLGGKIISKCPTDADWMLLKSGKPRVDVAPERTDTEVLTEIAKTAATATTETLSAVTKPFSILAISLAVVAGAYVVYKVMPMKKAMR